MSIENVYDARLYATMAEQPYPLLFMTISGSHLYGFPSSDSDYDLRGIHLLPLEQVVGLSQGQETVERMIRREGLEIDLVTYDIKKFLALLLNKNGLVLEQLYSPLVIQSSPAIEELQQFARGCITRNHRFHYLGFARSQWKLFAKENPPRVKPLLYIYRVLLTGIHLMQTGEVESNLLRLNEHFALPYIPGLIERKKAGAEQSVLQNADMTFYQQEYERLLSKLEEAGQMSNLPDGASLEEKNMLNRWLIGLRLERCL